MHYEIFISYSRQDSTFCDLLKAKLESLGLSVFVDQFIDPSDIFPERIRKAVMESTAVIAVWSAQALERPWVRREAFLARELHKLIPLAITPLGPHELGEFIDATYFNLVDYRGQDVHLGWSQMLAALARRFEAVAAVPSASEAANRARSLAPFLMDKAQSARPATQLPILGSETTGTTRQQLWEQIRDSRNIDELERFAKTFVGTREAFEAQTRADSLRAQLQKAEAARVKRDTAIRGFMMWLRGFLPWAGALVGFLGVISDQRSSPAGHANIALFALVCWLAYLLLPHLYPKKNLPPLEKRGFFRTAMMHIAATLSGLFALAIFGGGILPSAQTGQEDPHTLADASGPPPGASRTAPSVRRMPPALREVLVGGAGFEFACTRFGSNVRAKPASAAQVVATLATATPVVVGPPEGDTADPNFPWRAVSFVSGGEVATGFIAESVLRLKGRDSNQVCP